MISLIVFLPLIGFLYCSFFGKLFGDKSSQIITNFFLFISTILSWIIFFKHLNPIEKTNFVIFNWIKSGSFLADWSFRIDALTSTMLIVVTTVSFCVHMYSIGYMKEDKS